jgi:hypothetical protein
MIAMLLHGVETDGVALGIKKDGDETVFADGELGLEDLAAMGNGARGFHGAVFAGEVDERATSTGCTAVHFAKRTTGTGADEVEDPAAAFAVRLATALEETGDLTEPERRARAGLTNRQVTLR